MPPEQWAEVREIVETALELTGAEQATYVNRACAGKPECRAEVESLLEAGVQAGDFLEHSPVASRPDAPLHLVAHEVIGHRVGPYQITKIIGEGGMAVIYEAVRVDGEFEHRVAVKMVKAGLVPEAIAARFKVERQILAGLRHPSIAQLLDGGVSDGVPYFILELVEGKHIDEYCNRHRLAAGQRLALFGQVCDAVQYAHSKGIIHRDSVVARSNDARLRARWWKALDLVIMKAVHKDPARFAHVLTQTGVSVTVKP